MIQFPQTLNPAETVDYTGRWFKALEKFGSGTTIDSGTVVLLEPGPTDGLTKVSTIPPAGLTDQQVFLTGGVKGRAYDVEFTMTAGTRTLIRTVRLEVRGS